MSRAIRSIATIAPGCARKWRRRRRRATSTSAISRRNRTCSRSWRPLFAEFGATGAGKARHYIHDDDEATPLWRKARHIHRLGAAARRRSPVLRGPARRRRRPTGVDIARHADLKIGVVPVINLEWIQKLHRDRSARGYSTEAVTDTILRRMPDYVNYICPQFTLTDINFQRVPTVDTSNPFIARWIPTPDESMVVIRFKSPRGIDFPYLLSMIAGQLHVARELHRHSRRQARSRDAAHPDADDLEADRPEEARAMTGSDCADVDRARREGRADPRRDGQRHPLKPRTQGDPR